MSRNEVLVANTEVAMSSNEVVGANTEVVVPKTEVAMSSNEVVVAREDVYLVDGNQVCIWSRKQNTISPKPISTNLVSFPFVIK